MLLEPERVKVWRRHNRTLLPDKVRKDLWWEMHQRSTCPQCWPQSHRTLLGSACLSQTNQHTHTGTCDTRWSDAVQQQCVTCMNPGARLLYLCTVLPQPISLVSIIQSKKQNKLFGISREGLAGFSCYFLTNVAHLRGNSLSCHAAQK